MIDTLDAVPLGLPIFGHGDTPLLCLLSAALKEFVARRLPGRRHVTFSSKNSRSVMHKDCEEEDDREGDSKYPKQKASAKAHG